MATWSTKYASSAAVNLVVTATESEVNIANNTSKVTVTVQLKSSANQTAWNGYSQSLSVRIDGVSVGSKSFTYSIPAWGTATLGTYSRVVPHNSDGTKTARIQVSASGGGDSGSIDKNLGLTTIARASEVSLTPSTVNFGEVVRIKVHKKSSGFTSTVKVSWGSGTTVLWNKISWTEGDWTLPREWAPPNGTTGWGRIIVDTYNGTTLVGTKEARINGSVPNNATFNPTANAPTFAEKNTKVSTGMSGVWVSGQSKVEYKATFTTRVNATAKSAVFRVVHNGKTYNHTATISGTTATFTDSIGGSGAHSVQLVLTDSRGRVATSSASSFTAVAYSPPRLTVASANRSASSATSLLVSVTATGSSVSAKNTMTLKIYTKPVSSLTWTHKHTVTSTNGSIKLTNHVLTGYAETTSFDVQFELYDELTGSIYSETTIGTTKVLMDAYRDWGMGIGRMYDPNLGGSLQVGGNIYFNSMVVDSTDTGWLGSETLLNGFTGYIRFRRYGKLVHVRGAHLKSFPDGRQTYGVQIFSLPAQFRPQYDFYANGVPSPSYTSYPEQHTSVITIDVNGSVVVQRSFSTNNMFLFDFTYSAI